MIELDVHAHLAPINPARLSTLSGVQWREHDSVLQVDDHRVAIRDLFEPRRLIEWMDSHHVRRALVSIPPPLYRQHLDPSHALAWVRYLNEELSQIAATHPDRLGALHYLPMEHPGTLSALVRAGARHDVAGYTLAAGGHAAIVYSNPCYEALWAMLNESASFVFLHPGKCCDARLSPFYLDNLLGNPYETGVAAAHLVMSGVLARHPRLRFCLAHAGGVFPAVVGRLQRGFDTSRPGIDRAVERPRDAARRFYVDSITHDASCLQMVSEVLGPDRILFGSDWPFPMGSD
jgi:aminocarboxymuconate-semialdehyde decarboxylase